MATIDNKSSSTEIYASVWQGLAPSSPPPTGPESVRTAPQLGSWLTDMSIPPRGAAPGSRRLGARTIITSVVALLSACGGPTDERVAELGGGLVAVQKTPTAGSAVLIDEVLTDEVSIDEAAASVDTRNRPPGPRSDVTLPEASDDFYLAIRRDLLDERWFLSAYIKQFHPGNADSLGDALLGTRVVSFKIQNDRLFLFDASEATKASEIGDPTLLLEAYPLVNLPEFAALPGSEDYVLIDPAQGLNDFSVTGSLFVDPYVPEPGIPVRVGLSYMQGFHELADGAAFEQVFAGDMVVPVDALGNTTSVQAWGTLGIALRRYAVGEGYEPTPAPEVPYFFTTAPRLVPDSAGATEVDPLRWNFYPGMEPVEFLVTAGAQRAQADFPDSDLIGAIRRGIEGWNAAFGFEALKAVFTNDDRIVDDDENAVFIDYPGQGLGFAFADLRENPVNGEVRGGSVYMSGIFFTPDIDDEDEDDAGVAARFAEGSETAQVSWGGIRAHRPICNYAPQTRRLSRVDSVDDQLTASENFALQIQRVLAHEMGHVLGLRHNFKGSLLPPGTSLMDYTVQEEAGLTPEPQSYDIDAIRYLYQLSPNLPAQPFCTDEDTAVDPTCGQFDSGGDPLSDSWAPLYSESADRILEFGAPIDQLEFLNEVLAFARDPGFTSPETRALAIDVALGRSRSPLSEADLATPGLWGPLSAMAEHVLRRAVLDPPELRGSMGLDITDPDVLRALAVQAGRMARNEDGARGYALRRTSVDVLRALQQPDALAQLQQTRRELEDELENGGSSQADASLTEDLLTRARSALSPYFD